MATESPSPGSMGLAAAAKLLSRLAAGTCFAIGLAIFATSLIATLESPIPGPIQDYWTFIPVLEALERGENILPLIFKLHGGAHRLFVPKLVHLAEYSFFQGRNVFSMAMGVIVHLLSVVVLVRVIQDPRNQLLRREFLFAVGLTLALSFSATQYPNFLRPWNIHWYLCTTGMIAAFALLLRLHDSDRGGHRGSAWIWWVGTVGAGLIANFSMGNGLLIWPSLLLVGFATRLAGRFLAGFAVAGAISIHLFNLRQNPIPKLIEHPAEISLWVLKCLGVPISWSHETFGMLFAGLGMLAAGVLALRLLMRRTAPAPAECLLLGLGSVAMGSVAMASIRRMSSYWYLPRYQTIVLLFWLSLTLLGLLALRRRARGNRDLAGTGVMLLTTLWLAGIILPAHFDSTEKVTRVLTLMRLAQTAVLMGIEQRGLYEIVLPFSDLKRGRDTAISSRAFLEERRLGVFADGHHELLARSMNDFDLAAAENGCRGEVSSAIEESERAPGIAQVLGWVAAAPGAELQDVLLIANPDGTIVGLAEMLDRSFDPLGWFDGAPGRFGGYARISSSSVDVFAISKNGTPCPVARGVAIQ